MGITASVSCNCYRDGKTTPCPIDDFVYDPKRMPSFLRPDDADEDEADALYVQFARWLEGCCEHRHMNYAIEFITSWKGYQAFAEAIEALGEDNFPHLYHHLPEGEDGITPPEIAAKMLDEIARFVVRQSAVRQAVLVDNEREVVVSMGSHVGKGVLTVDRVTGYDLGFDEAGFFVRDRLEMNRTLFQAQRVEQRLLRPEQHQVEYIDRDSGRSFVCNTPFGKVITGEDGLPRMVLAQFEVEMRPLPAGRFAYILDPLQRILSASVATQNPVRWH